MTRLIGRTICLLILTAGMAGRPPTPANAQETPDDLTTAEWKCEQAASKALTKYFGQSIDCIAACRRAALTDPSRSCSPFAFDPKTVACLSRARGRSEIQLLRSCAGPPCPECYDGGDCARFATEKLGAIESFTGTAFDTLLCDDTFFFGGVTSAEAKCQAKLATASGKLASNLRACFAKCQKRRQAGAVDEDSCRAANFGTPEFDPNTQTCIDRARKKFFKVCPKCFDAPECWQNVFPNLDCSRAADIAQSWAFEAEPQQLCVDQPVCGDGRVSGSEECDPLTSLPGCSAGDYCTAGCSCATIPDRCAEAGVIPPLGAVLFGETSGPSTTSSACGGGGPEAAFVWVPAATGTASIDTCGSSFDTVVSIRTICDDPVSQITCNDDFCGLGSRIQPVVQAGVPYYIFVDGLGPFEGGPFRLNVIGTQQ